MLVVLGELENVTYRVMHVEVPFDGLAKIGRYSRYLYTLDCF